MEENSDKESENATHNELSTFDCQELNEEELNAIKGDTIGDTVYSAKWILSTLISLSKVDDDGWSKTLEEQLCMLWDMTAEKDIVDFLVENDFLRIAEFTLEVSKEPRLTEIILGIIGNMCCQSTVLETVGNTNKLLSMIFGHLTTDDPETLIQVLRFLQAAVWDIQKNDKSQWMKHIKDCEILGDAITFMLQSSTNDDLLVAATNLLQSISAVEMPDEKSLLSDLFEIDKLMASLLESFMQLVPVRQDDNHSYTEIKFIEKWLTIISTIIQSEFESFSKEKIADYFTKIMNALLRFLEPYKYSSNLLPLEVTAAVSIHDSVEMIAWFQQNKMNPKPELNHAIVAIMHGLRIAKKEAETDSFMEPDEKIDKLVKYLETYWLETLIAYTESELLEIIEICDQDLNKSLKEVATENSTKSKDALEKLLRVESLR